MTDKIENHIQAEIFRDVGGRKDVRIFRNNVGTAWQANTRIRITPQIMMTTKLYPGDLILRGARPVHFGLLKGSGDLIGIQKKKITKDMVGQTIGRFISLEVKTRTGPVKEKQGFWKDIINRFGGRAGIVRSVEDARELLDD
jgi:hypothetical protein